MSDAEPKTSGGLLRKAGLALGLLAVVAVGAYFFRAALLTSAATFWVINETPVKADAIVVLGGSPDLRPPEAARLYHAGVAPRILYMDVKLPQAAEMGITLPERELTRRILLSNNVPESAITGIGKSVASTSDESLAVQAWMVQHHAKTIVIPTDIFPTRRTRWIFTKRLKGIGAHVYVEAIVPKFVQRFQLVGA